jgi:hypothetical protein
MEFYVEVEVWLHIFLSLGTRCRRLRDPGKNLGTYGYKSFTGSQNGSGRGGETYRPLLGIRKSMSAVLSLYSSEHKSQNIRYLAEIWKWDLPNWSRNANHSTKHVIR